MGKRKVAKSAQDDFDSEGSDEAPQEVPKKRRQSTPKKPKFTEPFVDAKGWHVVPPSLIWRDFGDPEPSERIAAFDLDGTLVNRKSSGRFATSADDWKWWNKKVPKKLAELAEDGYKIVIFSNQGSIKGALDGKAKQRVEDMIDKIYKALLAKGGGEGGLALQAFLAPCMEGGDPCRKPAPGMWQHMVAHCNGGIKPDLKECFFVGDADGSEPAHSDADSGFAAAVGLTFHTPTEYFGDMDGKPRVDREAVKAAAEGIESGENPNADLVTKLRELSSLMHQLKKDTGDAKLGFKAIAYQKASDSLSTFPDKISGDNLKAVGKLQGVGKGTLERIQQYLKTGSVMTAEEAGELGGAAEGLAGAPAEAAAAAPARQAAFAFM